VSNTILSPVTLVAPLLGGAIADVTGFGTMYLVATALTLGAVVSVLRVSEAQTLPRVRA
jgi:hypothetical protein